MVAIETVTQNYIDDVVRRATRTEDVDASLCLEVMNVLASVNQRTDLSPNERVALQQVVNNFNVDKITPQNVSMDDAIQAIELQKKIREKEEKEGYKNG